MIQRHVDLKSAGDGPPGLEPDLIELLRQIPAIRQGIAELRHILTERRKSHLTCEEFAELTGRAPYTIRAWIKQKKIAAIRVAGTGPKGRLLIPREELEKVVGAGLGERVPEVTVG